MPLNKLTTIAEYWRVEYLIGNNVIQKTMIRNHFCEILQNLHFADDTYDDKTDRSFKVRPVIEDLKKKFAEVLSNKEEQSINKHMVKVEGCSSTKQYIKPKPIKWGFQFWCRCASKTGYLYQININLGKKQNIEFNLGEKVVLQLTKDSEGSIFPVYFGNFFNSSILIEKLLDQNIYAIRTVHENRKQMPKVVEDKKTKRGDCEFLYLKNVMAFKWVDNRSVLLVSTALEGMDNVLPVPRKEKGSARKSAISCPTAVQLHNNCMGGVDFMDQTAAAYQLDRKSSVRFYLRIFFDLLDISCVISFLVYNMKHTKQLTLFDYKTVIVKNLIDNIKVTKEVSRHEDRVRERVLQLQAMSTVAIYQSFSQHEKDAPIVQKKGKKIERSLYA